MKSVFKEILREYLDIRGFSQDEVAEMVGDTQQAVSNFVNSDGKPHKNSREKYLEKLEGFNEFYNNHNTTLKQKNYVRESSAAYAPKTVSYEDAKEFFYKCLDDDELFNELMEDDRCKRYFVWRASSWAVKHFG